MQNYYDLDRVGQELFRLYPDNFGIRPNEEEAYIALAVKTYFMELDQEQRLMVLRNLVEPQRFDLLLGTDYSRVEMKLTRTLINREYLGMIATYAVQMCLQEFSRESKEILGGNIPGADITVAAGLKMLTAGILRAAHNAFDPKKMSDKLEQFIRELYIVIVGGE